MSSVVERNVIDGWPIPPRPEGSGLRRPNPVIILAAFLSASILCSCSHVDLASTGIEIPGDEVEAAAVDSALTGVTMCGQKRWVTARGVASELTVFSIPVMSGSIDKPGSISAFSHNATLPKVLSMATKACADLGATDVRSVGVYSSSKAAVPGMNEAMTFMGYFVKVNTVELSVTATVPEK